MMNPEKSVEKKGKIKKNKKMKRRKEQETVIDPVIICGLLLSHEKKKYRDRIVYMINKWIMHCFRQKHAFKEDEFVNIWEGLFHGMWFCDQPLIQEELCENISIMLEQFPPEHLKSALLMYKAGLRVLATEWYRIDQLQMNKFLMLVRRYLRASLRCLQRYDWSIASCKLYAKMISGTDGIFALKTPRYARNATPMLLHIMDCYLEEITMVSIGKIPGSSLAELLRPMYWHLYCGKVGALCSGAGRLLFVLLLQTPEGLRYREARYKEALRDWHKMRRPEPEASMLVSGDKDQNGDIGDDRGDGSSEKPLDPCAGCEDVEQSGLSAPVKLMANMLNNTVASANFRTLKRVKHCLERFVKADRKVYLLRVKRHVEEMKRQRLARAPVSDEQALRELKNNIHADSTKRVKFVLKMNMKQSASAYYRSIRRSPQIPYDSQKRPMKSNLKFYIPSPINPFYKGTLKSLKCQV